MKKIFFLTALLCASVMASAKQYCDETLTLSGGAEIQLSCISASAGNYQIVIKGTNLNGLGGSFYNPGAVDLRTKITTSTSTLIVCDIEAESAPSLYTPLYVMCPGEQNISWPSDIEWGVCSTSKTDPALTLSLTEKTLDADAGDTCHIIANRLGTGALSCKSSNNAIATVVEEDGKFVVSAIGRGTATITISVAETADYAASSKKATITVNSENINWDALSWVGNGSGDPQNTDKYKVAPAENQNVINIQQPGWATAAGIYTEFPAIISSCDLDDGNYQIQGTGIILYLSAFSYQVTKVTVTAAAVDYEFYVYYAGGTTTAIDNTVVGEKAIKVIENGQLIIIKNGVKYNAIGTQL